MKRKTKRKKTMMKMRKMMNKKNSELKKREKDSLISGKNSDKMLNLVSLKILPTDKNSPKFQDGTHQETPLNWPVSMIISKEWRPDKTVSTSWLVRARKPSWNTLLFKNSWRKNTKFLSWTTRSTNSLSNIYLNMKSKSYPTSLRVTSNSPMMMILKERDSRNLLRSSPPSLIGGKRSFPRNWKVSRFPKDLSMILAWLFPLNTDNLQTCKR